MLDQWREKAIGGIDPPRSKQRKGDPVQAELDSGHESRIGEWVTMQVELLPRPRRRRSCPFGAAEVGGDEFLAATSPDWHGCLAYGLRRV